VALAGLALPKPLLQVQATAHEGPAPTSLGRIILWRDAVREAPSPAATWVAWRTFNEIIPLYGAVVGAAPWPTNPVWYRTHEGYIHSGYVQPVENQPQTEVIEEVSPPGFWAEVSVPIAEARWQPTSPYVARRLYYETVYRVTGAMQAEDGSWWYQLHEGLVWGPGGPYVPAWSLRRITREDLAPISPARPNKWMQINIEEQSLTCFEGYRPVFHTPAATGLWNTSTPLGEFRVLYKRYTRRMIGGEGANHYDLPGIPFPVYFAPNGVAIHGTYWHNDYGRRHSHGCVNVPSQAARWIFRWVHPPISYNKYTQFSGADNGTRVVVI